MYHYKSEINNCQLPRLGRWQMNEKHIAVNIKD